MIAAASVIILFGLRSAQALLVPTIIAMFLSVLSAPLLRSFRKKRIPAGVAVISVVLIDLAVIAAISVLVATTVAEVTDSLPEYRKRFDTLITDFTAYLNSRGLRVRRSVFEGAFDPANILAAIVDTLSSFAAAVSSLVLILLAMVFILLEAATFRGKLAHAIGDPEPFLKRFSAISNEVQRYLGYKTGLNVLTGIALGLICLATGVDFPLLWGLVGFFLSYIPNLGSLVATVPPVFLALVEFGFWRAVIVLVSYVVTNTLLGNVLEPMVLGRRLGLSPLVVFLSLILWGWVWGPIGMLLSVPLTMVVKISLENSEHYGWIAVLLDSKPVSPKVLPKGEVRGPKV